MDQPIDPDLLLPDCFEGLLVLDRTQGIEPSPELVTDPDDPDFGLPMYYTVYIECGAESEAWSEKGSAMPGAGAEGIKNPWRGTGSLYESVISGVCFSLIFH